MSESGGSVSGTEPYENTDATGGARAFHEGGMARLEGLWIGEHDQPLSSVGAEVPSRACDHGWGDISRRHLHVAPVHGWLRVFIRCWDCNLRIPIGWRWQFRSAGHALNYYEQVVCHGRP